MSCPPLPPILAMLPVSSVASFPPPIWIFFCMENVTLINRADAMLLACVASMAMGSCSDMCALLRFSECHCTGADSFDSETEKQHDSCVRSLCCRSLSSGAMFWRLALHVFLAKQSALPGYNVLLFTWTQTGFLTVSVVKAETWWPEKCVFLHLYATKSNILGTDLLLNCAQFLLTFHDQEFKYKDVVLLW